MNIKTAYSTNPDIQSAVSEIQEQLYGFPAKTVLFFASPAFDPEGISAAMQTAFGNTLTFGCTTAGEIVTGKMLNHSIVAMAFNATSMHDIKAIVLKNIKTTNPVAAGFKVFEDYYGESMITMDVSKYFGMILIDGLSGAEEKIMEKIGDLTNVIFVGASAGDDGHFKTTHVFANGKAHTDAALLVLAKPGIGFDFLKTQSFSNLGKELTATRVNEKSREVVEFNGKSAPQAYADALGVPVEEAAKRFMTNPVGLMMGDEPYVRSPQQIRDNKMVFYCNVMEGMELSVLQSRDIVKDTDEALEAKIAEMGGKVEGIINFNCILRTQELESKGQTEAYGALFKDVPTVGFSTYGEEYIGHINQTSTMILFK